MHGAFADAIGSEVKALARVGTSTMLGAAIAALREAGIERIAVVGGSAIRDACGRDVERVVEESSDGGENLRRALRAWEDGTPLLYLTSDMPFITGTALRDFLDAVPDRTLALPLTEWPSFERRFPGAPPFGITLGGERVVNGGAFVIPAFAQSRIEALASRFFDSRKSPWRMAQLAGPALLMQFALRRLRVAHLETRARALLGIPALAVRNAAPELAYDVDTFEEYRYAAANA